MTDEEWGAFFSLLNKIVTDSGEKTDRQWRQLADEVWRKAREYNCEADIHEFILWMS